jgi:hypothetical protein
MTNGGTADERSGGDGGRRVDDGVPRDVLEMDGVFEALASRRRRAVCYALTKRDEWSLSDLATTVAAIEAGVPEQAVSDEQQQQTFVGLFHSHVPKLAERGIVDFDERTKTVVAGERAPHVLALLQALAKSNGQMPSPGTETGEGDR